MSLLLGILLAADMFTNPMSPYHPLHPASAYTNPSVSVYGNAWKRERRETPPAAGCAAPDLDPTRAAECETRLLWGLVVIAVSAGIILIVEAVAAKRRVRLAARGTSPR